MMPSYSMRALTINSATAKIRFSVIGLIFLPTLTPSGAQSIETGTTQIAAKTLTKPMVPIGAPAGVDVRFMRIIKRAPGTHTNSDTADEVPIQV